MEPLVRESKEVFGGLVGATRWSERIWMFPFGVKQKLFTLWSRDPGYDATVAVTKKGRKELMRELRSADELVNSAEERRDVPAGDTSGRDWSRREVHQGGTIGRETGEREGRPAEV